MPTSSSIWRVRLGPLRDEGPLQLGECGEDVDHEPTHRARQVDRPAHQVADVELDAHPLELSSTARSRTVAERAVELREDDVITLA